LALTGCIEDPETHQPPAPRKLELALTQSTVKQIDNLYSTPGSVASDERIEVSSRTTGYIQKITAHEGDVVSKGDILVEINPTDIEGAINRTQASLSSAQTALNDAEQDVVRLAGLLEKGVASNEAVRKANVGRDVAQAQLANAQAALDIALAGRRDPVYFASGVFQECRCRACADCRVKHRPPDLSGRYYGWPAAGTCAAKSL